MRYARAANAWNVTLHGHDGPKPATHELGPDTDDRAGFARPCVVRDGEAERAELKMPLEEALLRARWTWRGVPFTL
ncbi:hypothetical protein ACWD5V_38965 [Streptomyces sp. NPDC002523]